MTHAFFKGLLFLGSGSVIHGMHDEQDIKKMGGLKKYMPTTYKTFLIGTIAISGIPFLSGFFSKDEILWHSYVSGGWFLWVTLAIAAFFTAFYMFRLLYLTFHGKERFDADHVHPHESPKSMTIPLIILAVLSAIGGFIGIPYVLGFFISDHPHLLSNFLDPVFAQANHILGVAEAHELHPIEYILMIVSTVVAIIAFLLARSIYNKDENWTVAKSLTNKFGFAYKILWNKWYLDNFYYSTFVTPIFVTSRDFLWKVFDAKIVDGAVNGTAFLTNSIGKGVRRLQSGVVQTYAAVMMLGILILIGYMIF
jgi:NADH-quinone oxidoreductase subunit L